MTGFAGLLFTSTSGARFIRMPTAASSRAVTPAADAASASLRAAPNAIALGKCVAPSRSRTTVAAFLVRADQQRRTPRARGDLLEAVREDGDLPRRRDVLHEEDDAADPVVLDQPDDVRRGHVAREVHHEQLRREGGERVGSRLRGRSRCLPPIIRGLAPGSLCARTHSICAV